MPEAPHSPQFQLGLKSIAKGEILAPPLRAYLANPEFKGFDIKVRGIGRRTYDGLFHPSEHPSWPVRALWLYLVAPSLLIEEPPDPSSTLAMTVGSVFHAIIERSLLDLDLLVTNEVSFRDERLRSTGKADGLISPRRGEEYASELFELKGLALDTPLPTPDGWITMADVQVGDRLYGSNGVPCRVTGVSDPKWVPSYRIVFDDGSDIVADADHRWVVLTGQSHRLVEQVMTTEQIAGSVIGSNGQAQHRVSNALPLLADDAKLPIHPYVLGAWIGDGSKHNGAITQGADSALWGEIESCGYELGEPWGTTGLRNPTRTIFGLRTSLIEAGLLNAVKRIPGDYMRASVPQRLDLLRGLMDTDGTWSPQRKNAVFTTVDVALAEQVRELVVSLGMRCRVQPVIARGFGIERPAYQVVFRPFRLHPFRIKGDRSIPDAVRSGRRVISRVDRLPLIQTKCVEVDSPDHTYLCGRQMVPTHNTMKDMRLRKIETVEDFIRLNPEYYLQCQEYMRMSGYQKMRFLLMALTFPFEMAEFVVEYDLGAANKTANKYREAIQAQADQEVPMCDGCAKAKFCPARAVCESASYDMIKEIVRGSQA